jgi:hypothetical protein
VPFNPPITDDELALGTAAASAVTVTTTVETTMTVVTPFAPVDVAGAGVTRGVDEVSLVAVPLGTMEEGKELEATLAEAPELKVVARVDPMEELTKPLVMTFDVGLVAGVLAMLVVGVLLPTAGVALVVGLLKPNVGAYDEPN